MCWWTNSIGTLVALQNSYTNIRTYTAAIGTSLYSKFNWIVVRICLLHFYSSIVSVCSVSYNNVMSFCSVSTIELCQSHCIIAVIHALCLTPEFMTVVITFHCLNRERAVRTTCIRFWLEHWFWIRFRLGQWFWIRFYLERWFSTQVFHLDTGFSWFPCVYKQMLRWFPRFQVATTCFSCSPPDLNLV